MSGLVPANTVLAGPATAGPAAFPVPRALVSSDVPVLAGSNISVVPTGGISSTNVQSALAELDTEKAAIASLASVAFSGAGADMVTNGVAWTPALTFATPGDLAVAYSAQFGRYWQLSSNIVLLQFTITTSTFTWTTASGNLRVDGLPFTLQNTANLNARAAVSYGGITKAGYSTILMGMQPNSNHIQFSASGSGVAFVAVVAADLPSAGTVTLIGEMLIFI